MKRSDFKYFYQQDFLNPGLHELMLDTDNQCLSIGMTINPAGSIELDDSDYIFKNRYKDNSIVKQQVSKPLRQVIELLEAKLIDNGVKNPILFNLAMMVKPNPNPLHKNYGWHKDYNLVEHVKDPLKLWFTILTIGKEEDVTSTFMVSPTPEGPDFWNIGVKEVATSNKLFGHNMNLGHEYSAGKNNEVTVLYCRWYDKD